MTKLFQYRFFYNFRSLIGTQGTHFPRAVFAPVGSPLDMLFPHIWNKTITRLKKFTTLLPKLLAETPEALAARERISKINWNFFKEKTAGKLRFSSSLLAVGTAVRCSRQFLPLLISSCKSSIFFSMISSLVLRCLLERKRDTAPTMIRIRNTRQNNWYIRSAILKLLTM